MAATGDWYTSHKNEKGPGQALLTRAFVWNRLGFKPRVRVDGDEIVATHR
jgi:hypothetical protein